ncbi:MAG TPA: adenylate/guanylate cyclase domain-containing protein [Candidatus Limnocylindria bacterium]|nr:adenylate/guanylate cyclase domain-containing protein [Candidatus Limnocylindria bacterium]
MGATLPTGTVTFLFTDIEGSTELLRSLGTDAYDEVLVEHGRLMRGALREGSGGREVRVEGDSFFVVFSSAQAAVAAVAGVQRALASTAFPHGANVRVRMGLHTGEGRPAAAEAGADYVGIDVHRAARIAAAAHGGQAVVSASTRSLVEDALPEGVSLKDLGTHRLKDFAEPERLYQLVVDGLPAHFPPLRTLDRTANNLPEQLTTFIGREREKAEGVRLLSDGTRLLTLTGPGGTGKTRLSIEIASELLERFPDGVYWVPLGPLSDPALVVPTIATSLGLQDLGSVPVAQRVAEHLRARSALLVIDNFEQLLPAAPVVAEILKAAPSVRAIVSSRAPLRIYGESEFPVPPLSLPEPSYGVEALTQSEAARLFVERARATRPDFEVTAHNAAAIAEVVRRVDGLPLAIELAAARVKLLTPEAIAQRLGHALDLLSAGSRDLPDRQRTLRGAIAWSYDLLDPPARTLFARLAVFVDGADVEDVEAVCGPGLGADALDVLMALVDHSLVRQREVGGVPRVRMLVTIREYALERLEEEPDARDVRRRHAERCVAILEAVGPRIFGPEQKTVLDRIERDAANLRAAVEWSVANDPTAAARLLRAAWRFWQMRGHLQEGRLLSDRVLAAIGGIDADLRAKAIEAAGGIAYWQGDLEAAERWYAATLEHWRGRGDERETANALYNLSFAYLLPQAEQRRLDTGRAALTEALGIYRRLGDERGIANVLFGLVNLAPDSREEVDAAGENAREAVALNRRLGDPFALGWSLHMRGLTDLFRGDPRAARDGFAESLRLFHAAADVSAITLVLTDFALLAMLDGDVARATRLAGAADALRERSGTGLVEGALDYVRTQRVAELRYPGDAEIAAHRAAYDEGRALGTEAAVAYALEDAR